MNVVIPKALWPRTTRVKQLWANADSRHYAWVRCLEMTNVLWFRVRI